MQIQKRRRGGYRVLKDGGKTPGTFTGTAEEYEDLPDEYKTTMLPDAVIKGDFVPQDIPEGYDPYINNSMEQKIFDNLGMEGVLEYRKMREGIHEDTGPVGEVGIELLTLLEGGPLITSGVKQIAKRPGLIKRVGSNISRKVGLLLKPRKVPNQALLDEFVESGKYILDNLDASKIKTGVSKAPINVKHGTHAADITADNIKLFEKVPTRGHRPGPKGGKGLEEPGGFYTARGDRGSTFMGTDSRTHQIGLTIPKGSRYIDLSAAGRATDNLPIGDLQKLYQEGYDYIIGKNILGGEEIIPLNPKILKSFKYNYESGGKVKSIKGPKIKVLKK